MNTPLRRSGMARVLKGSHNFTCTPRVHPLTEYLPCAKASSRITRVTVADWRRLLCRRESSVRWVGSVITGLRTCLTRTHRRATGRHCRHWTGRRFRDIVWWASKTASQTSTLTSAARPCGITFSVWVLRLLSLVVVASHCTYLLLFEIVIRNISIWNFRICMSVSLSM